MLTVNYGTMELLDDFKNLTSTSNSLLHSSPAICITLEHHDVVIFSIIYDQRLSSFMQPPHMARARQAMDTGFYQHNFQNPECLASHKMAKMDKINARNMF